MLYFATTTLGLFGAELAALANFFVEPFTRPSPRLLARRQALLSNLAGFHQRALGRLADAVPPFRAAVDAFVALTDWHNAASAADSLSELLVTIGKLAGPEGAVASGEEAVTYADRSGDGFHSLRARAKDAAARWQRGLLVRAELGFRQAETLQRERQPHLPFLYSAGGYTNRPMM